MRQKAQSKQLAFVICFLCLPVLISCGMYAESMTTAQWQQGCEGFPSVEEVKQVLGEHNELVQQIEDVSPGHVFVHLTTCPRGAFITIEYGGISEKMEIEKFLKLREPKRKGRGMSFGNSLAFPMDGIIHRDVSTMADSRLAARLYLLRRQQVRREQALHLCHRPERHGDPSGLVDYLLGVGSERSTLFPHSSC